MGDYSSLYMMLNKFKLSIMQWKGMTENSPPQNIAYTNYKDVLCFEGDAFGEAINNGLLPTYYVLSAIFM